MIVLSAAAEEIQPSVKTDQSVQEIMDSLNALSRTVAELGTTHNKASSSDTSGAVENPVPVEKPAQVPPQIPVETPVPVQVPAQVQEPALADKAGAVETPVPAEKPVQVEPRFQVQESVPVGSIEKRVSKGSLSNIESKGTVNVKIIKPDKIQPEPVRSMPNKVILLIAFILSIFLGVIINKRMFLRPGFEKKMPDNMYKVTQKVTQKVIGKVTNNQVKILRMVADNRYVTAVELMDVLGISLRKVKENLRKLKDKGLLKRIGPDKGGYWEVVEAGRSLEVLAQDAGTANSLASSAEGQEREAPGRDPEKTDFTPPVQAEQVDPHSIPNQ